MVYMGVTSGTDARVSSKTSLAIRSLHLYSREEALGQLVPVIIELGGVEGPGVFGVHYSGALVALHPLTGLELQLGLVMSPGALRQGQHRLAAHLQTQTLGLQGHVLDEVPI